MIIGITGLKGSGKSTAADYLCEKYGFIEYALAFPLKKIGKIIGFSQEELYVSKTQINPELGICAREFMQKVGTDYFRNEFPRAFPDLKCKNIWIKLMQDFIDKNAGKNICISDVRFDEEAHALKQNNAKIIKISNNSRALDPHESENGIDDSYVDYFLLNTGTLEELYEKIDLFMSSATSQ